MDLKLIKVMILIILLDIPFVYFISGVYPPINFSYRLLYGALVVYLLLAMGVLIALKQREPVITSFLIGLIAYGTYSFTSYAIYPHWPLWLAFFETVWGGVLLAMTSYLMM